MYLHGYSHVLVCFYCELCPASISILVGWNLVHVQWCSCNVVIVVQMGVSCIQSTTHGRTPASLPIHIPLPANREFIKIDWYITINVKYSHMPRLHWMKYPQSWHCHTPLCLWWIDASEVNGLISGLPRFITNFKTNFIRCSPHWDVDHCQIENS